MYTHSCTWMLPNCLFCNVWLTKNDNWHFRELYPKLEIERKLGKFCTVSSVSHEPRQSVSSDEQSDTQHNRNGSLIIDNESQLVPLACGNQTDTQKDMNVSSQAQIRYFIIFLFRNLRIS